MSAEDERHRDAALAALVGAIPFAATLGISISRRGDELTATMRYANHLIGNPILPALHGGATAAFMEVAAIVELAWGRLEGSAEALPALPRTIDMTIDYLRPGLPRDAYARARVNRSGRRYASVHVEAWQEARARPFAQATGHFLMPPAPAPVPGGG
ncbi:MAG: PaaI family thioesterase [Paracoccaceae bacterium]